MGRTYALIGGVIILAVAIVVVLSALKGSGAASQAEATPLPSADKTLGDANAPVVVLEYADFQCPYCRQFETGPEQQLKKDYVSTGKVRFIFRNMAFIGQESTWAAEAAECANAQGQFWAYHDKLYSVQGAENSGVYSISNLKKYAAEVGLDTQKFNRCLDSNEFLSRVQQEIAQGQQLGVNATPTLFVDGKMIQNGSDYTTLKAAIDAALASKGK